MSLNSNKHCSRFHFKKHYIENKTNEKGILIKPFIKLIDVWFSKEQNIVVSRMCIMSLFLGLLIGFIIGFTI